MKKSDKIIIDGKSKNVCTAEGSKKKFIKHNKEYITIAAYKKTLNKKKISGGVITTQPGTTRTGRELKPLPRSKPITATEQPFVGPADHTLVESTETSKLSYEELLEQIEMYIDSKEDIEMENKDAIVSELQEMIPNLSNQIDTFFRDIDTYLKKRIELIKIQDEINDLLKDYDLKKLTIKFKYDEIRNSTRKEYDYTIDEIEKGQSFLIAQIRRLEKDKMDKFRLYQSCYDKIKSFYFQLRDRIPTNM